MAEEKLSNFYAGGSRVEAGTQGTGGAIPSSGQLSISDFYGAPYAVFITATGGTVTTSGDYKTHTFTSSGTFTVTQVGNSSGSNTITVDVVGGGGAGAGSSYYRGNYGGSAGSGGRHIGIIQSPSVQSYSVTVGAGGQGSDTICSVPNVVCGRNHNGPAGGTSTFNGLTATGGGGGIHGYLQTGTGGTAGSPGGSAGITGFNSTAVRAGGSGWNGYGTGGSAANNYGCYWACETGYKGADGVVKITYKYQ